MIRGAIILAVGFSLGYAKAVSEQEEIRDTALAFKKLLEDLALQEEIKKKQAADAEAVDSSAVEVDEPDEGEIP